MGKATIITTPGGEKLAVLALEDYERLISAGEDLSDVRAYDDAKRKLASGEEEMIPSAVVDRLLDGGNKVRVWREYRGMTARELAVAAAVSTAYLSQIETGARAGTIDVMKRIADALRVKLDDIA